jgi:hypothetical protein
VIEASSRTRVESVLASAPEGCAVTLIADRGRVLRTGRSVAGHDVRFVDSVLNAMVEVKPVGDELLLHVPSWSSVDPSVYDEVGGMSDVMVAVLGVVDRSGARKEPGDWRVVGAAVFGNGGTVARSARAFVITSSVYDEVAATHSSPALGPPDVKSRVVPNDRVDILDPTRFLDVAVVRSPSASLPTTVPRSVVATTQVEWELAVREAKAHWIAICLKGGSWEWEDLIKPCYGRSDRDALVFPRVALVNPGSVRRMPPVSDPSSWVAASVEAGFRISVFDASGTSIAEHGLRPEKTPSGRALRVAVTSMCGVTSFEDRYGLGGEHQVVHWLKEAFDEHPDVAHCDIYDTANGDLADGREYDLVLSNSCWLPSPKLAPGGVSIFWHFNTNAHRGDLKTVAELGYTHVWTNSRSCLREMRGMGLSCSLKHLNASSEHHGVYRWDSKLFVHDACYVGGYQTEYKGKDLIDAYVKVLCGAPGIDMAIYGNRKWLPSVQRDAMKTDAGFKPEHHDESFGPYYKHVLHPDDFMILAKNCKVWINFNSADQRPLGMVNDRPIWAMSCGAFVITDDSPEQRALYGDTCDYSAGGDDLVERVRYWLSRDQERLEKGAAARENIMRRGLHTRGTVAAAIAQCLEGKFPNDAPGGDA